jgi:hypothetical protein
VATEIEQLRALRAKLNRRCELDDYQRYNEAIDDLTPAAAVLAAEDALEGLDDRYGGLGADPESDLDRIVDSNPEALRPIHQRLIEREMFFPQSLYRSAEPAARDRLIAALEATDPRDSSRLNELLMCLAHVGDDGVVALFARWRAEGRKFEYLHLPPWRYANEAGWELDDAGWRRDLYSSIAYALVPRTADEPSAVEVVTPHEETCRWCQTPMLSMFEFDLTDPRVQEVIPVDGRRLRIAYCLRCSDYGNLFTDVDGNGGSRWRDSNERPKLMPATIKTDQRDEPAQRKLVLGDRQPSPFRGGSQLGGQPSWVNDAANPACPQCGKLMPVIAQIEWEDIDHGDGVGWAFLCAPCGVASTGFDCT